MKAVAPSLSVVTVPTGATGATCRSVVLCASRASDGARATLSSLRRPGRRRGGGAGLLARAGAANERRKSHCKVRIFKLLVLQGKNTPKLALACSKVV